MGLVEPTGFFEPGGAFITDSLIEVPRFPEATFYYRQGKGNGQDLLIFLSEAQPSFGSYDYVLGILDVAQKFGVQRVYTLAAALVEHHVDKPRVLGAATSKDILEELKVHDIELSGNIYVAGLNGLMLGAARERGLEGVCLLGETARYAAKLPNARAACAVLRKMADMVGVAVDMKELDEFAASTEKEVRQLSDQARSEFIQQYTTPIWEREEREENN